MDEIFKIFTEQLKDGDIKKIDISCASEFLDVTEEALRFKDPIQVNGEVYLADDAVVLHFDAATIAIIPCSICNAPVKTEIKVNNFYHMIPLEEIKNGYFNFQDILREAILLEVPAFAECNNGQCQHRKEIAKYLKSPNRPESDGHQPFADINLDQFKP
jgi:uncharacterized metal-binding protein YceD (DUF177 family)